MLGVFRLQTLCGGRWKLLEPSLKEAFPYHSKCWHGMPLFLWWGYRAQSRGQCVVLSKGMQEVEQNSVRIACFSECLSSPTKKPHFNMKAVLSHPEPAPSWFMSPSSSDACTDASWFFHFPLESCLPRGFLLCPQQSFKDSLSLWPKGLDTCLQCRAALAGISPAARSRQVPRLPTREECPSSSGSLQILPEETKGCPDQVFCWFQNHQIQLPVAWGEAEAVAAAGSQLKTADVPSLSADVPSSRSWTFPDWLSLLGFGVVYTDYLGKFLTPTCPSSSH